MAPMSTLVMIESLLLGLHAAEQNRAQKQCTARSLSLDYGEQQVLRRENGSEKEKST